MDNARPMRHGNRTSDFQGKTRRVPFGERTGSQSRRKRFAVHIRHRQEERAIDSLDIEGMSAVLSRTISEFRLENERGLPMLATMASVSPLLGLLGTVWGVMVSFVNIGAQGSATLVVVAPGIAEALIATIAGLAAAIPSVIGYNHCLGKLREIGHAAAQFASEYLDRRLGARHG